MFEKPAFGNQAEGDIPEKFLVTSKVVNMAPCSDRKGRKEVMMVEGRKRQK